MFVDITPYPFLQKIIDNIDIIEKEFLVKFYQSNLMEHFAKKQKEIPTFNQANAMHMWISENNIHPSQAGYDVRSGEWTAFALFKKGADIKWYDPSMEFPLTYQLIKDIPNLNLAGYFRLAKNAGTKDHVHSQKHLIFHLCLSDLDGESIISCEGHTKILKKKGDYCMFDYSKTHSSFNHASNERINFIIDFSIG